MIHRMYSTVKCPTVIPLCNPLTPPTGMFWKDFPKRVEIWLMTRQKPSLKLQTRMEMERLGLMVRE